MIYLDTSIDDFDLQQALSAVSEWRREQALRYRQERDRRLCVAAYRLLQRALRQEYGLEELPQFTYDQRGKPSLVGHPEVHFSLSHCRQAVACAVDARPVGIDVETLDHYTEEVAARTMSDSELRQIQSSPHPALSFTRLWTMKESLFKVSGDDGNGDIAHLLADVTGYRFTTIVHPDYVVTVCHRQDDAGAPVTAAPAR